MAWEQFKGQTSQRTKSSDKILVRFRQIFLTKKAYQRLRQPKKLVIYYDSENKLIKLKREKKGAILVRGGGGLTNYLNVSITRYVPEGHYYFKKHYGFYKLIEEPNVLK